MSHAPVLNREAIERVVAPFNGIEVLKLGQVAVAAAPDPRCMDEVLAALRFASTPATKCIVVTENSWSSRMPARALYDLLEAGYGNVFGSKDVPLADAAELCCVQCAQAYETLDEE